MKVAAVVLAAGESRRLGRPKQMIELGGERLLERAVRVACEAGCDPVVVVVGASAGRIIAECRLDGAVVIENAGWAEGMGSSVRAAVAGLHDVDGVIVMACDMPAVTTSHIRALMQTGELTASRYADRAGVPAYFPASTFEALRAMAGDEGARHLLREAGVVELRGGELDIDTQEDVDAATLLALEG